jgi:hypothetical protein
MKPRLLALLAAISLCAGAAAQDGGRYGGATPIERAQLPMYCYALHVDSKLAGHPQYDIPSSCGVYMNHYCEGLIFLLRAQKTTAPARERKNNAGAAASLIQKTIKAMTPQCPLRADAEGALLRARTIYGSIK